MWTIQGLEVWRRILKINDRGERRRNGLAEPINNPKAADKCENVAKVLDDWDTNQRLEVWGSERTRCRASFSTSCDCERAEVGLQLKKGLRKRPVCLPCNLEARR